MQEGKPKPNHKIRRGRRPIRPDLQIKGTAWTDISPKLRSARIRETPENKEKVIVQFKVPVTKKRQLTAYEADIQYDDGGYESNFTSNTHNLEHTYVFNAETEFDANATVNSNGEIEGQPPNELMVKAASSTFRFR